MTQTVTEDLDAIATVVAATVQSPVVVTDVVTATIAPLLKRQVTATTAATATPTALKGSDDDQEHCLNNP